MKPKPSKPSSRGSRPKSSHGVHPAASKNKYLKAKILDARRNKNKQTKIRKKYFNQVAGEKEYDAGGGGALLRDLRDVDDDSKWSRFPSVNPPATSRGERSDENDEHSTVPKDLAYSIHGLQGDEDSDEDTAEEQERAAVRGKGQKRKHREVESDEEMEEDSDSPESDDSSPEEDDEISAPPPPPSKPAASVPFAPLRARYMSQVPQHNTSFKHPLTTPRPADKRSSGKGKGDKGKPPLKPQNTFQRAAALAEQRRKEKEAAMETARIARAEREAARDAYYSRRKTERNAVLKKTKRGQPVMGGIVERMLRKIKARMKS
ncbi:hypothetical protein M427DRAFT_70270 [Gonapodya prolifera JEL478]|uniref:rRNA-processing protein FYV7 n=1 Tax=Gonapodya prolifera (strain JEL478) TaxID=1344416 RepID=A0A139ADR2_GONPJ|nr:hypothetical protein M427DRAFT_70270 [Gonapodya prolifera JEL478]|eukprot:KXS14931.1 hypothetical protein M427DRAFT_70270 [Gonapodya prolifera JEL478]